MLYFPCFTEKYSFSLSRGTVNMNIIGYFHNRRKPQTYWRKALFSCVFWSDWDIEKGWNVSQFCPGTFVKQGPACQGLCRVLRCGHTQRVLWSASAWRRQHCQQRWSNRQIALGQSMIKHPEHSRGKWGRKILLKRRRMLFVLLPLLIIWYSLLLS